MHHKEGSIVAIVDKTQERQWFSDKEALRPLMDEIDRKAGIVFDPTMTGKRAREILAAQGIRPEDNLLSRDIIRARYPEEEIDEE
jgi:hypothetical protein